MAIVQIEMPLISICIPVYNGEKYISEAIESIVKQKYSNIELIVQDNASTDKTWEILNTLKSRLPFLKIERNSKNVGMTNNWNLAIDRAIGDYIMLLSADDMMENNFINRCIQVLQNPDIQIVTTNHYILKDGEKSNRKIKIIEKPYNSFCRKVLLLNPFSINFTVFKKEVIAKISKNRCFFRRCLMVCDYDLWLRISFLDLNVYYLAEKLGTYRVHETNLSRQVLRMNKQTVLTILAHKKQLQDVCPLVYKLTLLRFIFRNIRNIIIYKKFDKRTFVLLMKNLLSPRIG